MFFGGVEDWVAIMSGLVTARAGSFFREFEVDVGGCRVGWSVVGCV